RKSFVTEPALNKFFNGKHAVERTFLVKHTRAIDPCKRAQDHLIPVIPDFLDLPQHRRHYLVAHLLRDGHAVALHLAVRVIGPEANKDAALPSDQHEFNLAAGVASTDLDSVGGRQPPCCYTVVDRSSSGTRYADSCQFGD